MKRDGKESKERGKKKQDNMRGSSIVPQNMKINNYICMRGEEGVIKRM